MGNESVREKKGGNNEQPMDRAFAILGAVVAAAGPQSVTDIAAALSLPVPTAHRLVAQLEKRGLLKRSLGSKKVVIGEAFVRLGISAVDAALRGDRPHQILLALSASLGEHVQVGIRSDNEVLYVDTARVPLSGPGLAATAILCFLFAWNDFFFALILTRTEAMTAPVAVVNFMNYEGWEWGRIAAGGTMIMLPVLVFSFVVRRYLVHGLTGGALKG